MSAITDANALIRFSFNGNSAPMPGTYLNEYGFCHTSAGPYVAGQVYYDDGFVHREIQIYEGIKITTTDAIIGDVTLTQDNIYVAESVNAPFDWTAKGGGGSKSFTLVYTSQGNLATGDLVFISTATNYHVLKNIDNNSDNPVIGIVKTLLSNDAVEVAHLGSFPVNDTLSRGKTVYVSASGGFTTTVPLTNFVQVLGVATSTGSIYLNPEIRRTKRA